MKVFGSLPCCIVNCADMKVFGYCLVVLLIVQI